MTLPNFDLPNSGPLPSLSGAGGNRPIAAQGAGPAGGYSNRPIPLQPGPSDEVPEHDDLDDDDEDDLREILRNAPAWLVSTVFHMLLLILLGLLAATQLTTASRDVAITSAAEPDYTDQMGTQLEDPSVLQGDAKHIENAGPEQIITPRDLPPVDDPLAARRWWAI